MGKVLKQKCQCHHAKEVHAPTGKKGEDYEGECCVIYRGPDGNLKSCYCTQFTGSGKVTK